MYIQVCVYIYTLFFVRYDVFGQCQWDSSCRGRRELSKAVAKHDCRLTDVEMWPFPFPNAPAPITALIVI